MKKIIIIFCFTALLVGCKKSEDRQECCNIEKAYANNEKKVTITNGIWGTVANMEGNCMPMVGPGSTCKTCTVQRKIQVYPYTLKGNATLTAGEFVFYDSFNSTLIQEVNADAEGFYEMSLPAGTYSVAIVENGKLYANSTDGNGGLNPVTVSNGRIKFNVTMTYKAVF